VDANIDIMASVKFKQSLASCGVFGVLQCYDTLMEGEKWATMRWLVFEETQGGLHTEVQFLFPDYEVARQLSLT
jgi:hypothetical protein